MPRPSISYSLIYKLRRFEPSPYNPAKPLARMSWNPINLFNLTKMTRIMQSKPYSSVYGHKIFAKRMLRSYHNPMMFERQLIQRHFVQLFPTQPLTPEQRDKIPPTQALFYSKVERRVETVIFRSHFAKSIFEARKLVAKGLVLVNGQKCQEPGYLMKDGDMLTVDPIGIPTLEKIIGKLPADRPLKFKHVPFMAAFMYTPRYLEVDYDTCSAVFLREPLPIADNVEIPSPFPPMLHRLLYEFYKPRYHSTRGRYNKYQFWPRLVISGQNVRLKRRFVILRRNQEKQKLDARKDANLKRAREVLTSVDVRSTTGQNAATTAL